MDVNGHASTVYPWDRSNTLLLPLAHRNDGFEKPKAPSACPFKFSPVVYAEADAHRPTAARMFQITDLQMCQSTSSHDIPSTFS